MKYYDQTKFNIADGNKSKTVGAIAPTIIDAIIADGIRELAINAEDVRVTDYGNLGSSIDRAIEIETGWGNSVSVYVRNRPAHWLDAANRIYADDEAHTELFQINPDFVIGWSSTSRSIGRAIAAIANYNKAVLLASAIESRLVSYRYYYRLPDKA